MKDIAAEAKPLTGSDIPPGPQYEVYGHGGEGGAILPDPNPTGAPFNMFLYCEVGEYPEGGEHAETSEPTVEIVYNREFHTLPPGQTQVQNIDSRGLGIFYKLEGKQYARVVCIYT